MAKLNEIIDFCNKVLNIDLYKDDALNGLQIESDNQEIESIAVAVDSGLSVIKEVKEKQLLIVHHGLFWGSHLPIKGVLREKIEHLLKNESSLAAYHLPLDGHSTFGNAARIFKYLGINKYEPGFIHQGMPIGAIAKDLNLNRGEIIAKLSQISEDKNHQPLHLNFGKDKINSIGICTGAAASLLRDAIDMNLDLFVTGEPKQSCYHYCIESKINASFIGHYASETFGVIALAELICQQFKLNYLFIDQPTGI